MNTIDTTNALEKDKTVNSDQKQFTSAETEPKRQTSFVSQFDTQTSPKKKQSKTSSSVLMMCMSIMVIAKRLKALISVFMKMK